MNQNFLLKHPRASTRAFTREARRIKGFSFYDWLHGYVYGRWPYLYISVGTGEHPLSKVLSFPTRLANRLLSAKKADVRSHKTSLNPGHLRLESGTFADNYHGKVMTLEAAKNLVTVQAEITLTNLEQVIPYPAARDIILQNPDHIVALECPCRAARSNPCRPLDVCLIVGEPFASFIVEHHGHRSRWLKSGEVLEILQAEHERGHVHHAFFKDAMLGRFYAICNCCRCCCGAMQAWQKGIPMLAPSGYICRVNKELCEGCGTCVQSCQFGAAFLNDGKSVIDTSLCMGCGVCVSKCNQKALALVRDPSKGEPLEIHDLMACSGST